MCVFHRLATAPGSIAKHTRSPLPSPLLHHDVFLDVCDVSQIVFPFVFHLLSGTISHPRDLETGEVWNGDIPKALDAFLDSQRSCVSRHG